MIPSATYRIQFRPEFGFADAERIVPYLHRLGITDVYVSPIFQARSGSQHGYDVTDPSTINVELGGAEAFASFSETLKRHDMGLVMDIVPNHMAASPENQWWWSVLENGPSSEYAHYFDISWYQSSTGAPLESKVLLPILGNHYGSVLEDAELQIRIDAGGLYVAYYDNKMPLGPKTYRVVLEQRFGRLRERLGANQDALREYERLIDYCDAMPDRYTIEEHAVELRRQMTGILKADLWRLYSQNQAVHQFVDDALAIVNGVKGDPASFDTLDRILSDQAYRLAYWRIASTEINYRRFFDIADLVAMRIEDDDVFRARHAPLVGMARRGEITGLRIDHIDGLHDPESYLTRLQQFLQPSADDTPFYVVVEKILARDERVPVGWNAAGTTGYDFLNLVNGLWVDASTVETLDTLYQQTTGITETIREIDYRQKRKVMAELFSGDVRALVLWLDRLTAHDRYGRDLGQRELGQALSEITARMPVYRTYTRSYAVREEDRDVIEQVIGEAIAARPDLRRAFRFLRRVLLLEFPAYVEEEQQQQRLAFVMRWQQFTSPIMAKGHEDTALYIYNRLTSANDVGSEPDRAAVAVPAFHDAMQRRMHDCPHSMNATSTHDTKRSEDVRARIDVLSELAEEWGDRVLRWREWNAPLRPVVEGEPFPDTNTEYLIYQTLLGIWPLESRAESDVQTRLKSYLLKAMREAKTHTDWLRPNLPYEAAVEQFVDALYGAGAQRFREDFHAFQARVAWFGALNSLSQTLLRITAPGVPDMYQGTEVWDFSLVDPDNRRAVDFSLRQRLLDSIPTDPAELLRDWQTGAIKMFVIQQALTFRRAARALFADGEYMPLDVDGAASEHVVAFARRAGTAWAVTVVPRLCACLARQREIADYSAPLGTTVWGDTRVILPPDAPTRWRGVLDAIDVHGDGAVRVADVLGRLPVALLSNDLSRKRQVVARGTSL